MKYLFYLSALAILFFSACRKNTICVRGNGNTSSVMRTLSPFTDIDANGSYEIYLKQDSLHTVKVEAESNLLDLIETEVSGSTLRIFNRGCISKMKTVKIYVTAKDIQKIELNGSGNVSSQKSAQNQCICS